MSNTIKKNKHLTLDDRIEIQQCLAHGLAHGMTFKAIAKRIGKDQTTVSKEIKKHIEIHPTSVRHVNANGQPLPTPICPQLLKAPFVCNACRKKSTACSYDKQFYYAKRAQREYEELLSEAREGIPLNKESFYQMDRIIADGVSKGQHIYHILQTHNLNVAASTVYRHCKKGYLSISVQDLPRAVKFKPRRKSRTDKIPPAAKIGRAYDDFLLFIKENDCSSWVEMDTVIGREGGKAILTFDFTFCNFMAGILLDSKTAAEVSSKIIALKQAFLQKQLCFGDLFPLLLTDNGGEFANFSVFEKNLGGEHESHLFFCDPYCSYQKPKVEKNHTLFRDIVPKGKSFDSFSQQTVNLIFSHVNSVKRKSLNGKSPYEMFSFTFGDNLAALLGISQIPPEQVIQSPKLLRV